MIKMERDGYQVEIEYPKWVWVEGGRRYGDGYEIRVYRPEPEVRPGLVPPPAMWGDYRDICPAQEVSPYRARLYGGLQKPGLFNRNVESVEWQLSSLVSRAIRLAEEAADRLRGEAATEAELASKMGGRLSSRNWRA